VTGSKQAPKQLQLQPQLQPQPQPQPQMQSVLDRLVRARSGLPSRYELPFEQAREHLLLEREPWLVDGPECAGRDRKVECEGRAVSMRIVMPPRMSPRRILVYLHGGGWCVGSSRTHDAIVRRLAGALGCEAWSIDYALAPESPYPQGLRDVVAAIRLAAAEHPQADLIVAGDSAGANLALDAALQMRDAGDDSIAALLLFYGVYTDDCSGPSMEAYGDGRFGLSIRAHRRYLDAYRGAATAQPGEEGAQGADAAASEPGRRGTDVPVFALSPLASLAGLPPAWLTVAELDILRDQSHALATRLRLAHVPVEVDEVPGVIHGFLAYGQQLDAVGEALGRAAVWARVIADGPAPPS